MLPSPDPAPDEQVALVDEQGNPVGVAQRSRVRRENLLHAATAVLVRRSDGAIYVHLRSPEKDWCPSHHDAAAGGVLRAGEDPLESAERELAEELGITGVPLEALGGSSYQDGTVRCYEHVFATTYDGPVVHADGEVVWGTWMTLKELAERLADPTWPFVPDTRALLASLGERKVEDYAVTLGDSTRASRAAVALGLPHRLTRHGRVGSLEEAARLRGVTPDRIVKSIVVRLSDDDYRFVLVPGDREISWPKLRALLGLNRLSMPSAEVALEVTGYERGTITPLGSTHPWPVIADASLSGDISLGAGEHGAALTVDTAALLDALQATVADVT